MTWDGVPWAVGGGALNSPEAGRMLTYMAAGGLQGVIQSGDLAVKALDVPGTQVRVLAGACVILNKALGGASQAYACRNLSEDLVSVAATSGSGARSDLVIARVENNTVSGEPWPVPPSVEDGPYVYTRVISNVPSTTKSVKELNLGYSAITLARIDIPISTGAITQAMIKDLRTVINPITGAQGPVGGGGDNDGDGGPVVVTPGGGGNDGDNNTGDPVTNTQTSYIDWPFNASWDIVVPLWATHADIVITISQVQVRQGSLSGFLRLILGGLALAEQSFRTDWPGATTRQDIPLTYSNVPIPADIRGTTVHWSIQAKVAAAQASGIILATPSTKAKAQITFKRLPETPT